MSEITGRAAALAKLVSELPDHLTPDPLLSADREREDAVERLRQALSLPVVRSYVAAQAFGHAAIAITAYLGEAAALSSPETTPAGVLALDVERLAKAMDLSGIGIAEGGSLASDWAESIAEEYDRLGGASQPAGVLDEAWAAAEKALPEGWRIWSLDHDPVQDEWRALAGQTVDNGGAPILGVRSAATPAAALHALAAALGRSGSGGGRG